MGSFSVSHFNCVKHRDGYYESLFHAFFVPMVVMIVSMLLLKKNKSRHYQ